MGEADIEMLAVQFRKTIEQVSLSSMILHVEEYSKVRADFENDWNARLIMQDLKRLNPEYFPKPVRVTLLGNSYEDGIYFEPISTDDYLSEKDFTNVYQKCGKFLHAVNPFSRSAINHRQMRVLMGDWETKLSNLLEDYIVEFMGTDIIAYSKLNLASDKIPELIILEPKDKTKIKKAHSRAYLRVLIAVQSASLIKQLQAQSWEPRKCQ
ncbi:MAG TPA: hypothetical protein VIH86_00485 [Puia sp.]